MRAKNVIDLLEETYFEWDRHKASMLAAALAYYSLFSLAPLLIIVIAVAGFAFGAKAARGEIMGQIEGLVGHDSAEMIQIMLSGAEKAATNVLASIIGLVTLVFGATRVFTALEDGLNVIWEVAPKPRRWWIAYAQDRFRSFLLVLGLGFALLVSLAVGAALSAADRHFGIRTEPGQWANFIVSFCVITALFAMIYKYLPDVRIAWRDVLVGSAVTALFFTIGKSLIGLYLGYSSLSSAYGAAGSLVVLLAWIYYSAQLMFLGAEFTRVYAKRYGSHGRSGWRARKPAA